MGCTASQDAIDEGKKEPLDQSNDPDHLDLKLQKVESPDLSSIPPSAAKVKVSEWNDGLDISRSDNGYRELLIDK